MVLSLYSCTLEERIVFDENGKGSFSTGLRMDSEFLKEIGEVDESNNQEIKDSIIYFEDLIEQEVKKDENIDSEKLKRLEMLKPYRLHMRMDPKTSIDFLIEGDFKSVKELGQMINNFTQIMEEESSEKIGYSPMGNLDDSPLGKIPVNYSFINNVFERHLDFSQVTAKEMEEWNEFIKEMEEPDEMGESMTDLMSEMGYKLVYEFPKPVRKINDPNAELSQDKKTVTIRYTFVEYLKNASHYNLRIELE